MTLKVLYFIAGVKPTTDEAAAIASLNAGTEAPLQVEVRTNLVSNTYETIEDADFVAGTVPSAYSALPVYAGQGMGLVDGGSLAAKAFGNTWAGVPFDMTVSIDEDGVLDGLTTEADGDFFIVKKDPSTTLDIVKATGAALLQNPSGLFLITDYDAPPKIMLSNTFATVKNGQSITVSGFTFTFVVVNNVITAITSV